MARKRKDLTNCRFGRLLVIAPDKAKRTSWLCKCDCGNVKVVAASDLTRHNKNIISCGCYRKEIATSKTITMSDSRRNPKSARNRVLRDYKNSASKRNVSWELSDVAFDYLISLPCHYCGSSPSNTSTTYNLKENVVFKYNGIDRIDNSKNYTNENVVPCCFVCNRAKNTMSLRDWYGWVSRLIYHMLGETTIVIPSNL